MDLILWRHADAAPGGSDLHRALTPKGHQQAAGVAKWLLARLPSDVEVIASPAVRAQQTARALVAHYRTAKELAPGATVHMVLNTAGWPQGRGTVIVVGHQPELGRTAAFLMCGLQTEWHVEKAGLWWFTQATPVILNAVVSPDLL